MKVQLSIFQLVFLTISWASVSHIATATSTEETNATETPTEVPTTTPTTGTAMRRPDPSTNKLFAITDAQKCAEDLPYGPLPLDEWSDSYFSTQDIDQVHTEWRQIILKDGHWSGGVMDIHWEFQTAKTIKQRFIDASKFGEPATWHISSEGQVIRKEGTWWFSSSANVSFDVAANPTGLSKDDGAWGGASDKVDGQGENTAPSDYYGQGNFNDGDDTCDRVYTAGTLEVKPELRSLMYVVATTTTTTTSTTLRPVSTTTTTTTTIHTSTSNTHIESTAASSPTTAVSTTTMQAEAPVTTPSKSFAQERFCQVELKVLPPVSVGSTCTSSMREGQRCSLTCSAGFSNIGYFTCSGGQLLGKPICHAIDESRAVEVVAKIASTMEVEVDVETNTGVEQVRQFFKKGLSEALGVSTEQVTSLEVHELVQKSGRHLRGGQTVRTRRFEISYEIRAATVADVDALLESANAMTTPSTASSQAFWQSLSAQPQIRKVHQVLLKIQARKFHDEVAIASQVASAGQATQDVPEQFGMDTKAAAILLCMTILCVVSMVMVLLRTSFLMWKRFTES